MLFVPFLKKSLESAESKIRADKHDFGEVFNSRETFW